jgi:DNA polymerase III delta prime subunit
MDWLAKKKNAPAYTNIEEVRTEIATFASPPSHIPLPFVYDDDRHRCVFLDEGDHIPPKAQAALRGIMEEAAATDYSNFILAANDGKKVDAAIRSRCSVFDFSYPDPTERAIITAAFRERIVSIVEAEGLKPDAEMIDRCLKRYGLDFRAVLNEIQKHT